MLKRDRGNLSRPKPDPGNQTVSDIPSTSDSENNEPVSLNFVVNIAPRSQKEVLSLQCFGSEPSRVGRPVFAPEYARCSSRVHTETR